MAENEIEQVKADPAASPELVKKEKKKEPLVDEDDQHLPLGMRSCRSVDNFEKLNHIDEGTFGVVFRARDKRTNEIVALKKLKLEREREGFPITALREINLLLSIRHPNVVCVKEVVVGHNPNHLFMVMEYMDHELKGLMNTMTQPFSQGEVKCLMMQLLSGIAHLHDNWMIHRDLKTSNLLYDNRGNLKICDFGLARHYGSPQKAYTQLVVTLWYRAPELLLGTDLYTPAIDMWSVGCIFAELLRKEPLFPGQSELDELDKIFKVLGTPNDEVWEGYSKLPSVSRMVIKFVKQPRNKLRDLFPKAAAFSGKTQLTEAGFDLLSRMLTYDPKKRITAADALRHPYFEEMPRPQRTELMPTFPGTNEGANRKRKRSMEEDLFAKQLERNDDHRFKRADLSGPESVESPDDAVFGISGYGSNLGNMGNMAKS